ncbi:MAG: 16S rRNA (adenine(1518)-N(6)/adenine(1519)-N(6))-dimethyltransferase RsmA [Actinomycetota bacterium]|nr:16S rRNA (adenine(1518)-N(6)/adenine(1519)-N(6))-dimethyltransferase RsmA [Actinomycetota bacterium]
MERFDLSPSRALGQNFLCDPNTAAKIVKLAQVTSADCVLEVGPGIGSLTVEIASVAQLVVAVEFDQYVIRALEEVLAQRGLSNVEVVLADALKADYERLLQDFPAWKLVANLPYNISAQLVLSILEKYLMITEMLVMVQREVGERMCAAPGTSNFSQVALKLGYFAKAKVVSLVSREVFVPKPNVDSVLLHVWRRPPTELDLDKVTYETVFSLSRLAFANRRQMIRRTLASRMSVTEIEAAGIDPARRPETLELREWTSLAGVLLKSKG